MRCRRYWVPDVYWDGDGYELFTDVLDSDVALLLVESLRDNVVFYRTSLGLLGNTLLPGDPAESHLARLVVNLGLTLVDDLRPVLGEGDGLALGLGHLLALLSVGGGQ